MEDLDGRTARLAELDHPHHLAVLQLLRRTLLKGDSALREVFRHVVERLGGRHLPSDEDDVVLSRRHDGEAMMVLVHA